MQDNTKILILYDNKEFQKQVEYTFHLMMSILGLGYKIIQVDQLIGHKISEFSLIISYGHKKPEICVNSHIHVYESIFFGKNYLKKESMPQLPLERFNDLPIIYKGINGMGNYVRKSKCLIETSIDIIASSFFMISRYEEIILKDRDVHGRFSAKLSLAYKEDFLNRPIVNEYIELLWNWINSFDYKFQRKRIWGDKDFAVCLTHDIDQIRRYKFYPPLGTIFRSVKQKNIRRAGVILLDYLKTRLNLKQDIYLSTFEYIINLEKKHGFRSSFYFMSCGKRYSLNDPWLEKMIAKLTEENFEIGIHPDSNTCHNPEVLIVEREKLENIAGRKISGGRQHYLRFNISESYKNWEMAGLKYDTSMGFADRAGFRCGICHPFKPFDILKNTVIDLWEIPLTVMDVTLFAYCKLSANEAKRTLRSLLEMVEKYNGIFVLLWHNNYMTELLNSNEKICFEDFYEIISQKKCFVNSVVKVLNYWQKNNYEI